MTALSAIEPSLIAACEFPAADALAYQSRAKPRSRVTPCPGAVAIAEAKLSFGRLLFRGLAVPLERLGQISFCALALLDHDSEIVLSSRVALLGSTSIITRRDLEIACDPFPVQCKTPI